MRVDLKVPFAEKDHAKKLGARWDPGRRVWYVQDVENIAKFMRWMPRHLTRAHGKPIKRRTELAVVTLNRAASNHLKDINKG